MILYFDPNEFLEVLFPDLNQLIHIQTHTWQ